MLKTLNKKYINLARSVLLLFSILVFCNSLFAQESKETINLESVVYSKLAGDRIQINLITDKPVADPGSFSTNNPPRIALDFFGMKKGDVDNNIKVGSGAVDSISVVETDDRIRLVINLVDAASYETEITTDGYAITIANPTEEKTIALSRAPKPFVKKPDIVSENSITNIDFRRSPANGAKVTVDLTDDAISADLREQSGELIIDFLNATLPAELEKRLDVVDFATPVQTIDAFQVGQNVRLVVKPEGKYQHISYQADNQFTLVVDPYVETDEEKRRKQFEEIGYEGERLSINFQRIDVRSAIAVIADFTGLNFVTSDEVQGELTLNLQDVPWDQALDIILKTEGLSKRKQGNVIWIAPSAEIASKEQAELEALQAVADLEPLVSEIIQINYARASDIAEVIKSIEVIIQGNTPAGSAIDGATSAFNPTQTDTNTLLTSRGNITIDERTNSLLIQDTAAKIIEIKKVIAKLDIPVRQVMIEARIVEATDSFSRELGSRLGFQRITDNARFPGTNDTNIGQFIGSGTTEGLTTITDSLNDDEEGIIFDNSRNLPGGLSVDLGASGIGNELPASHAFDIFKAGTGYAHLITLELSALEADGRGKIVASPRLVTANQREAVIRQGEERSVVSLGELITVEAVLKLEVTPQITPDDRVVLDVTVNQDAFINAQGSELNTKEINTQVLVDNGETIILGGIYQEDVAEGETKVPLLGDVPIVGNLFKKRSKRNNRIELLIFLTPKIISPKLNLG